MAESPRTATPLTCLHRRVAGEAGVEWQAEEQFGELPGLGGQQALFDPPKGVVDGIGAYLGTLHPARFTEAAGFGDDRLGVIGRSTS